MKTIGIIVDNYKVDKFKETLIEEGYDQLKVFPFTNDPKTGSPIAGTTLIQLTVLDYQIQAVHKICKRLQI